MIQHLTAQHVKQIHAALKPENQSVDEDALEKAIQSVLQLVGENKWADPNGYIKAAGYMREIIERKPFAQWNSLTAWLTARTFLEINGIHVSAPADKGVYLVDGILDGSVGEDEIFHFFYTYARITIPDQEPLLLRGLWDYE